jgi:hypothetical protein
MIISCPKCDHIYKTDKDAPCPRCGHKGKLAKPKRIEDLNGDRRSEQYHPKMDYRHID